MANSGDPDQTAHIVSVCSESMLFASILNSSVMLGNYLQHTTSSDDIFRCSFSWRFKGKAYWTCRTILVGRSHFQFYGCRVVFFISSKSNKTNSKQTMKILIRRRMMRHQIFFSTVCLRPIKRSLCLYVLSCRQTVKSVFCRI